MEIIYEVFQLLDVLAYQIFPCGTADKEESGPKSAGAGKMKWEKDPSQLSI